MKVQIEADSKTFNYLRRVGVGGDLARSRFNYANEVGNGLAANVIVAPSLWVARNLPEAPIAVQDAEGELDVDNDLVRLMNRPNEWYGGGAMRFSTGLDYTIRGDAYWEIERGRGNMPVALFYHPSFMITPKGTKTELITHYEQQTDGSQPRRIDAADMIHFRQGIDPRDQKHGFSALQSLLREVFTDEEAAAFTAAVLRNMGFPGVIISPADENVKIGPKTRNLIRNYFRRMFRGDQRGEAMVLRGRLKVDTLDVDLAKINIDKLRAIPEERVCAVIGIPAAVVGFGTGMEQTKVGATLKELRELAYENVIIPMQRVMSDELTNKLLPEFVTQEGFRVVFDLRPVRVLQEDENRRSARVLDEWRAGVITRGETRQALGREASDADDVYLVGFSDVFVPAGQKLIGAVQRKYLPAPTKNLSADQRALMVRFADDREMLEPIFDDELIKHFERIGRELTRIWVREQSVVMAAYGGNGHRKAEVSQADREVIDRILLEYDMPALPFEAAYLRALTATVESVNVSMGLGVMLDEPMERAIINTGGTRKGLVDLAGQTRSAMYETVAAGREAGLGPEALARTIRDGISAGPWRDVQTRALVIARTETKFAQNKSSLDVYQKAENVTQVQIFDAQIGPTDSECEDRDGRVVSFAEAESMADAEHPNGTISFAPVVDSIES